MGEPEGMQKDGNQWPRIIEDDKEWGEGDSQGQVKGSTLAPLLEGSQECVCKQCVQTSDLCICAFLVVIVVSVCRELCRALSTQKQKRKRPLWHGCLFFSPSPSASAFL
mmetsp:Transcript_19266/g.38850  ORF Transcript_19266/g.38850 Transcript_19266/m.38850 type:complete len:109 (+) Transcript_19266:1-327(+)